MNIMISEDIMKNKMKIGHVLNKVVKVKIGGYFNGDKFNSVFKELKTNRNEIVIA